MVELTAPDAVADRHLIARGDLAAPLHPGAEAGNRLEHPPTAIVVGVDGERVDHRRRYPACADLVTGKVLTIQHQHVQAGRAQARGTTRSGGAAADDQYIAGICTRISHWNSRPEANAIPPWRPCPPGRCTGIHASTARRCSPRD